MANIQSPLYITAQGPQGEPLLGGVFQMHDRIGFPVDACFEEANERGLKIDWLEALADCWLNDCLKFDCFERQASSLVGTDLGSKFKETGAVVLALFPKIKDKQNPVDVVCRYILAKKKLRSPTL